MMKADWFSNENQVVDFSCQLQYQKPSVLNSVLCRLAVVGMWLQNCKRRHFVEKESD